jgi:hypothetical protein
MSRAWQRAVKDADGGEPPVEGEHAAHMHAYLGHEGVEVVECLCDLGLGLLPLLHHAQMPVQSQPPKASPWPAGPLPTVHRVKTRPLFKNIKLTAIYC